MAIEALSDITRAGGSAFSGGVTTTYPEAQFSGLNGWVANGVYAKQVNGTVHLFGNLSVNAAAVDDYQEILQLPAAIVGANSSPVLIAGATNGWAPKSTATLAIDAGTARLVLLAIHRNVSNVLLTGLSYRVE